MIEIMDKILKDLPFNKGEEVSVYELKYYLKKPAKTPFFEQNQL